jgi:hypothetical protein
MAGRTKEEMRQDLKVLSREINSYTKYDKSEMITIQKKVLTRWDGIIYELSEDELLWK